MKKLPIKPVGADRSLALRRGAILVAAMWVIIILVALVLVFARSMRVEMIASANRLGSAQAAAIELGAEQYVLSQVDNSAGDASLVTQAPAEAMQVGDGYFWIIRPDDQDPRYADFGITDEAGKLNVNNAKSQELSRFAALTQDIADSIVSWRSDPNAQPTGQGASSAYYQSLPEPYRVKNGPFESIEELLLIKDLDEGVLYGYDKNHDAILEDNEMAGGGGGASFNSSNSNARGIFPFVTVYSIEPASTSTSTSSSSGSGSSSSSSTSTAKVNVNQGNDQAIQKVLTDAGLQSQRATQVMGQLRTGRPFANPFDFCVKVGLKTDEMKKVVDRITTAQGKTTTGLINVNTAPAEVLQCLGSLEPSDAQTIVAKRQTTVTTGIGWLVDLLTPQKLVSIGSRITGVSYQFSANIVAVSGDGRSFKRARIVVDARQSPPKIVYRRDLTSLGWPLGDDIRQQLKNGQTLQPTRAGSRQTRAGAMQ